jgi:hypothetical protein
LQITDEQSCGFISSRTAIVQEQQDGVITVAKRRTPAWCFRASISEMKLANLSGAGKGLLEAGVV